MHLRITAIVPGAPALQIGEVIEKPADEARAWLAAGVAVETPAAALPVSVDQADDVDVIPATEKKRRRC